MERRKPSLRKRAAPYGLLGPGALYLGIFFLVPLVLMLNMSLNSGTIGSFTFTWEFGNYTRGLSRYQTEIIRSLLYAGIVTAVALVVAYPVAYWIAFHGGKRKSVFLFLLLLPFFVSFVIRTAQWQFILSDDGVLFGPLKDLGVLPRDFRVLSTPVAVIAGITYNFLPFTALPLYVSLERIDKGLVEAGRDLYAGRVATFLRVVWPLSLPGVFAAFLLTFVPAVGDYLNAELLGGPGTFMVGNAIQQQFLVNLDYPVAAALSFVLMATLLVGASIYARVMGTEEVTSGAARA